MNQPARARKKRQPLRHTTDIQGRFSRSSIFRVCRTREPSPCICTIAFNLFLFQFAITKKKSKKPYKNYPNRRNAHANPTPRRTREPSPCISNQIQNAGRVNHVNQRARAKSQPPALAPQPARKKKMSHFGTSSFL